MVRAVIHWIDEQTGLVTLGREFMEEPLAKGVGWPHIFGSMAMFLFVVQACTGVLLMIYYVPSPDAAYESTAFISRELPLGGLVRGLHHWGASLMLIFVLLHMLQVFFWGAYKPPRQIIWVIGMFLLLVTMGLSFTGYLLPWDQKAYWATVVGTRIAGSVPAIGHHITALMRGGTEVGALTLSRFFAVHVLVLPALLIGLMAFHVAQVRKKGITPPWRRTDEEAGVPHPTLFYPDQVFKDVVGAVILLGVLFAVALAHAAPLEAKANPMTSGYVPRPEWYFLPNFEFLKYIPMAWGEWGEFLGAAVIPAIGVLFLIVFPYLDKNPERRLLRRPFACVGAIAALATLAYLGIAGARSGPKKVVLTAEQARGEQVFLDLRCHSCHGINGGGGMEGQDLAPDGPRDPEMVAGVLRSPTEWSPRSVMPAVSEDMSDADLTALVAFVSAIDSSFEMPLEASAAGPGRPFSHQEENWFANHQYEVRKDPTLCAQCHEPAFCQSCHQRRRPDSHLEGWLKAHFGTAEERPEYCQVCHTDYSCRSCHDVLLHTPDWMHRHPEAVQVRGELCQECHKPDFCVTCHEGARPVSHETEWMDRHAHSARDDAQACVTCHRTDFCQSCHGGVDLPHAADWVLTHEAQASFAPGSVCYRCHQYQETCAQCHGQEVPS